MVMADENVVAYYEEAIEKLTERVQKFEEIVETDKSQAIDYQNKYFSFDKMFFKQQAKEGRSSTINKANSSRFKKV